VAYVKRSKTDSIDAAAICEAVTRPSISFVPVKGLEQQGLSMLHSARSQLIGQRTQVIDAMRAHLSELGIIAARGLLGLAELAAIVRDERDHRLPTTARGALMVEIISTAIAALDSALRTENKASELGPRLETIPSVGPVIASAFRAAPFSPLMRGQLELSAKPKRRELGRQPPFTGALRGGANRNTWTGCSAPTLNCWRFFEQAYQTKP